MALKSEAKKLQPNGTIVEIDSRKIHVYVEGERNNKPVLVFMSGSATVAPIYDFKPLYSLLSNKYRIIVVEKTGYGYSDIVKVPRDLPALSDEVRTALALAGEKPPYVLVPHSMSGLEAIYWAEKYPEEVAAIIGLDMSPPESYNFVNFSKVNFFATLGRFAVWNGFQRIPHLYPLNTQTLTEQEIKQQKLLMYRNAGDIDFILESKSIPDNAKILEDVKINVPMLLFTSNGKEIGKYWLPCQEKFAAENHTQLIKLNCGHYIHWYEPEFIAQKMIEFLNAHF